MIVAGQRQASSFNDQAFGAFAGDDGRAVFTAFEHRFERIQPEAGFGFSTMCCLSVLPKSAFFVASFKAGSNDLS